MTEFGVNGAGKDFTSDFFEFFSLVIEGNDFGGADKGEVKGVEEEKDVLALVGADVDFLEVAVVPSIGNEVGSGFSDEGHIYLLQDMSST